MLVRNRGGRGHERTAITENEEPLKGVAMNSPLADELQFVVENGREKEPEHFFGVSRTIDS